MIWVVPAVAVAAEALLLKGGTVVDGTGAPPRPGTDVLVVGDRIAAVGTHLDLPADTRVVDVGGAWLVPGLVDAHVHLMNVPAEPYLGLDAAARDALVRHQLRSYLACGVTTVLDAGAHTDRMDAIRGWIADGAPAPRVEVLGPVLGPPGGYPQRVDSRFGGLATPVDVGPALDAVKAYGAIGTKIAFEGGFGSKDWPVFDSGMRAEIRTQAAARSLPVYVHAMTPADHVASADLRPHAYVHAPEYPRRAATRAIAASGAFVVTTLTVYDATLIPLDADRLADPLLRAAVPPVQVAAALDRATVVRARQDVAEYAVPWAPDWAARLDGVARQIARARLRKAVRAVTRLHEAGVPLVLGTDSGTWPFIQAQFHGWAAIREIELLGEAGLSPAEAIAAGTSVPARMLGLMDEIGTIEPGKTADIVVLRADPLADLAAFRQVALTVHAGVAKTPEEWMATEVR